ncbi:MAG TPA: ABC transporter ATP-binding protein [Thermoanaerobaculia bacterium]|jgi:branched-chain amino acid transport system ATP-binding protein|nr:ABC transporter ATP-binding protein [Thermoanaerobaculia bacterium]
MLNTETLLESKNVTIKFGGLTAVCEFNIKICAGELLGLIGPNGAGKTTLFNMLTGVYKPTEGEILIGGVSTHDMKPYQITSLGVARTFQNIRLFKELTVLDNVKIGGHIHYKYPGYSAILHTNRFRQAEDVAEVEAEKLLEIFGLHHRKNDYAKNLPYGDQRRLEIARGLAAKPKLLLLDEPAAGLNDSETRALMQTIHDIRDRFQIAILLIEHNMELVMGICERIAVLNFGKTIAVGTPEEIRSNDAVIEAYLGEPAEAVEL